jgi:homoserine O-acetyltransferase
MSLPKYLRELISPETQYFNVKEPVTLESGEVLSDVVVAYRTWGDPANAAERAVLICHALTGSADADVWWPGIIGESCAFDPATDFIICSNLLGGCYGTTGPASEQPGSDDSYRHDFPKINIRDMVEVQRQLLDELGVESLELVAGPSLGGMQVLEWAAMYPGRVRSFVPISTAGRHSAWCVGISEAQRAAIETDPKWCGGFYAEDASPEQGLAAARMMAMCSYRSWDNFDERFARTLHSEGDFQVQSYLRYQGAKINTRFDANSYYRLTEAMDAHDIARGRGGYPDILRGFKQPCLVVSVTSDVLYPPHEQQLLVDHLPNAEYELLDSNHGHDGFLIKTRELGELIRQFRERQRKLERSRAAKIRVINPASE